MRSNLFSFWIILFFLFVNNCLQAQTRKELANSDQILPLTKLYVHFDKDYYFIKDDVWLKIYLIDGVSHKRIAGNQNVTLDVLNEEGKVVLSKMYLISDGLAAGNFVIPPNIAPGKYMIRVYTDYSIKIGDEGIFYKPLTFAEVKNYAGLDEPKEELIRKVSELVLLPEGGFMLTGEQNIVAFKMLNDKGLGAEGELRVVDELGNVVLHISAIHKGKGKFLFTPEQGKKYFAEIAGQPQYREEILRIHEKGSKIQLAQYNDEKLEIEIVSKLESLDSCEYYLACMHRGNLVFYKELAGAYNMVEIETEILQPGINRFVLLDRQFQPLSERLVFSSLVNVNMIKIDKLLSTYKKRDKVVPVLLDVDAAKENQYSNLSVAVVSEKSVDNNDMNFLSCALLDAELRNFNENSLEYFTEDMEISSRAKLDLLMLTHGWTNYIWNKTSDIKQEDRTFTSGITLKGYSKQLLRNKPAPLSTIIMQIFTQNDVNFYTQQTDSIGRFSFENLYFEDSAKVLVQSKNKRRKNAGEVFLYPENRKTPELNLKQLAVLQHQSELSTGLYFKKYMIESDKRAFNPEYETIMLDDIEVLGKKEAEQNDDVVKIYGDADHSLKITEYDESFPSVLDYIASNVPGVTIYDNSITLRGGQASFSGSSDPLFLIDGISYEGSDGFSVAMSYQMSDISTVDVLKTPHNLSLFGSRGANGVIAIYTKKGTPFQREKEFTKGSIEKTIVGFAAYREFYSPEYTSENIDTEEPDGRLTLYWNPEVFINSGFADINFFTSDQTGRYRIIIEGISSEGKICYGTSVFDVIN